MLREMTFHFLVLMLRSLNGQTNADEDENETTRKNLAFHADLITKNLCI